MQIFQNVYLQGSWQQDLISADKAQLVMLFGDRDTITKNGFQEELRSHYPNAEFIGCTTSGEIAGTEIYDNSICLTAMEFANSHIKIQRATVDDQPINIVAKQLAQQLPHKDLRYVLVLSDGQKVNGTELVKGLVNTLPDDVLVTGGLAGDGTRFDETMVWHNGFSSSGQILICGFYGENLCVAHGSMGGWDSFGPERQITQSSGNVLQTLDDKPALELYKKYLGDYANQLPSSALLFPLQITRENQEKAVTRTILNINEDDGSMTFAGDMPKGAKTQLMRANFDRLIDGAETAAEHTLGMISKQASAGLILMISCVGRRLVLKQRTEEELEAVKDMFGDQWISTGFYSYGEISPFIDSDYCELHNQTMTITTITEKNA